MRAPLSEKQLRSVASLVMSPISSRILWSKFS